MESKPNLHLAVWLLLESLGILSHTIKPSAHRWIFFVVITSIATYAMIYTRMDFLHLGMTERGMSSRILMIVLFASTDILLCNPQKELRLVGQKENISEAPFLSRLWWGIIVWGNPRGVNFTHEPTAHIPPRPTHKTRTAFVISQFLSIAFLLLIYDLNGFMNRANPYYGKDVLVVTGYQRLWRLAGFGYCIVIYVVLMIQHKLYSIISVALRITTPRDWPALYHSLFEGYTLRRMWGKAWHQILRRPCTAHANFFARVLGLPPKGRYTAIFKLHAVFFVSGLLHHVSEVVAMQSLTEPLGTIAFFLLQAVAITVEEFVIAIARKAGFTRSGWLTKLLGYVWVFLWISFSLPYWIDAVYKDGWTEDIPHFSIILGLWRGEWLPSNKPNKA